MITIKKTMITDNKNMEEELEQLLPALHTYDESLPVEKRLYVDEEELEQRLNALFQSEIDISDSSITESDHEIDASEGLEGNTAYLMNISDHIASDISYTGEIYGKYIPETRMYYAFWKPEETHEIFQNMSVGFIISKDLYYRILENEVRFEGYAWFGAYIDGCWCFHRCDDTYTPIIVREVFSFVTKAFSRNSGLLETATMMNKTAVIIGQGSVGSYVAMQLAKSGIGHLILIDGDLLEIHNLSRHYLTMAHIGEYKTEAMKHELHCINPYLDIQTFKGLIQDAPKELFQNIQAGDGIVISTGDNRACGKEANILAEQLGIPFISIGCWTRACTGEIFTWVPGSGLPTYGDAFDGLINDVRNDAHRAYLGQEQEADQLHFEPGIYSDLAFITEVGIKLITDLLNLRDISYIRRVYDDLTNYT